MSRFLVGLLFACALVTSVHAAGKTTYTMVKGTDGRRHRIAEPLPYAYASTRGIKTSTLVATDKITPQVLFGKSGKPDMRAYGQGFLPDCYAVAAIRAYADTSSPFYAQQSSVIKSVFLDAKGSLRRSKAGVPQARFFHKSEATGRYRAVLVDYTGEIPMHEGKVVYSMEMTSNHQAWGPLLEEAYWRFRDATAKQRTEPQITGYGRANLGGMPGTVMEALTGRASTTHDVAPESGPATMRLIKRALARGDVVAALTPKPSDMQRALARSIELGVLDGRSRKLELGGEKRIVGDHSYTVMKTPDPKVELSNPWDSTPVGGAGRNGIGEIPQKHFPVFFNQIQIGAGAPSRP